MSTKVVTEMLNYAHVLVKKGNVRDGLETVISAIAEITTILDNQITTEKPTKAVVKRQAKPKVPKAVPKAKVTKAKTAEKPVLLETTVVDEKNQ
jgi:hypothetical protein